MAYFSSLLLVIRQRVPEILVLIVAGFEHSSNFVLLLDVLEKFCLNSLCLGIAFFGPTLPGVEFPINRLNLRQVLASFVLAFLDSGLVAFIVVYF